MDDIEFDGKLAQEITLKSHFFDLSLDLLCLLDPQGLIEHANPSFRVMLHLEHEQLKQASFAEFVYAADRMTFLSAFRQAKDSSHPVSFACRFYCFDGTMRWYLWTLYPHMSSVIHAVGKDITPYKEMETKEAERNIFAEALLDTVLAINSSLALDQVLERIQSNIGKVVAYEYVTILFVDADEAEVVGGQNGSEDNKNVQSLKGQRFSISENKHLNYMFHSRESIIVLELDRPPAWMVVSELNEVGSFLGSPIVVDNTVIGFLSVFNSKKEFFTPLHAQQLITFANQAGIAINNARLYEQAQSAAVLRERQRMAQELHDAVNQDLFAASTYADLLPKAIMHKPDSVALYVSKISNLIRGAVDQMRMILIELHPDTLTTTGLEVLLQQLCNVFSRQMGIPISFNTNTKIILEEQVQIAIYRIAQEALHNVNKHAKATHVKVTLLTSKNQVRFTIEDNGCGFHPDAIIEIQFGIRGMRERARNIQADLFIKSEQGYGTKIELRKEFYDNYKKRSNYYC
jgi:PAS domain S-box-containing protein